MTKEVIIMTIFSPPINLHLVRNLFGGFDEGVIRSEWIASCMPNMEAVTSVVIQTRPVLVRPVKVTIWLPQTKIFLHAVKSVPLYLFLASQFKKFYTISTSFCGFRKVTLWDDERCIEAGWQSKAVRYCKDRITISIKGCVCTEILHFENKGLGVVSFRSGH